MKVFLIIPYYFAWHYSGAFKNLLHIWRNYSWFVLNYFSIKNNFIYLFSPYKRVTENTKTGDHSNREAFFVRFIMRILGILLRSMLIVSGIISLALVVLIGVALFIIWLFLPIILAFMFISGLVSLF